MNFNELSEQEKLDLSKIMFQQLNSSQEVKNWVKLFLGLELPLEITDPDSTSSPLDAIWQIYNTFKNNTGDTNPGYILMSAREGMKCAKKSTITSTYNGFKKIEDVKVGDVIWTGFSWQKVTQTFDEGMKPGLKVSLDGGHTCTGTPIHRYWCLRDGTEQWIAGKDLNPETDLVCLNVNTGLKDSHVILDQEKYDVGYFLGLLTGDGGLSLMDRYRKFTLTNMDAYVNAFFDNFCHKYFPGKKICVSKNGIERTVFGQKSVDKLKEWGLTTSYSWEKQIPSFAYSSYDAMKGFIAGVFDTDGCWDKKGDCFFEMTAGPLLDQIQVALTSFGIESRIRHNKKLYGMQKHLVSRLTIGQTESAKLEKIGIFFRAKKAQKHKISQIPNCKDTLPIPHVKKFLDVFNRYGHAKIKNRKFLKVNTDQEKYYQSVTTDKLSRLCLWMHENYEHGYVSEEDIATVRQLDKILLNKWKKFTVENAGEQYFYDLTVENEHSYWSNGLISHNTISVAILETLLLLHFQLDIGHAAATEEQSSVGLRYMENFLASVEPLMLTAGWMNVTQNKRRFEYRTPEGKTPFIKIVICNPKGMNSLHANVLFLDELDLADPKALKEGKYITSYSKGIHGVKVYLSTRKYAFGNMAKAIEDAPAMGYKILNWNVLDVTERCPEVRHKPGGEKKDVYVSKKLPLLTISSEEYSSLPDVEKIKFDLIKDAHEGCAKCPILPVCRMRLAEKPKTATGGFYKPITSVIQQFKENDPDSAEAQLLCFGENANILMGDGTTKPISQIAVGDSVITHTGKVRPVTETFKRPYSGKVLTLKNHAWKHFEPTFVTPEHPIFVNGLEFKNASDLKTNKWKGKDFEVLQKGDYLSLPKNYEVKTQTVSFHEVSTVPYDKEGDKIRIKGSSGKWIPETFELTKDFGWLVGYFLAEGYFSKDKRRGSICSTRKAITFCSDVRETEYHERVKFFARSLGLETSEFSGKRHAIDIYNTTLSEFFYGLSSEYSDEKKINPLLMDGNIDFLTGILEGFDAGDGTKRFNSYKELTTWSEDLATQLFLIAGRLGLCPRVTRKPLPKEGKQPYLVHYINRAHFAKQKRTRFVFKDDYNQYRLDDVVESDYEGFVYNFEVKDDHSYIVDGIAVHNCWRPGSTGLVYPRFSNKGNVFTVKEAFESMFGPVSDKFVNDVVLLRAMREAGVLFYAGVDWGYTHDFVICIVAMMPTGEVWLIDTYASPGLEFSDMLEIAISYRDKYRPHKWYCDQAMPSNIKSFRKNGMPCPKFVKDVMGGIEALRSKIVAADGSRKFKIILNESNKKAVSALSKHKFILDGQGNLTLNPDDESGISDICDTLRYIGQNLFPVKGPQKPEHAWIGPGGQALDPASAEARKLAEIASHHESQMKAEISKLVGNSEVTLGSGKKGGFFFTF
jgi:intein/homing endonuclease